MPAGRAGTRADTRRALGRADTLSRFERDEALLERIGWSRIEANEKRRQRRNFWIAFGFMAPAIALVAGLLLTPVVYNIYLSLTKWKKFKGLDQFAGVANYERLAGHRHFGEASLQHLALGRRLDHLPARDRVRGLPSSCAGSRLRTPSRASSSCPASWRRQRWA